MTKLKERIVAEIEAAGPITVSDYMARCLFDPEYGYYTTQNPFGTAGDFTTAPEISQLFGETVGVWLYASWQGSGTPHPATICEIGPGRGTMARDILRVLGQLCSLEDKPPAFTLVETSPRLREVQEKVLETVEPKPCWFESVSELDEAPLFIVGNELFDAIPIRQFIRKHETWHERVVTTSDERSLHFAVGANLLAEAAIPLEIRSAPEGTVYEYAPQRIAMMEQICAHLSKFGGAALFIDYGSLEQASGDTLQAVRDHKYEGVFENPGGADLTSHVDFASLETVAKSHGLECHLSTQSGFLLKMGILERAGAVGRGASLETQQAISGAVERLAGPDAMGDLFKVIAIYNSSVSEPPFIVAD